MSNIEIRGVEYRKTGAGQAILNGANAWVTFDGGPVFYNTAQFPSLVSAIPWPSAPAVPTDYFNAPELAQLNVEVGVVFQISNYTGTSIGGYVRVEIVNRTTSTVLATIDKQGADISTAPSQTSTAVVNVGTINSNSPASLMYADNPYINVAAGDHIGIRVTNALTSPATITVGQFTAAGTTYYPLVRAFEWTYSTDPANTLPQTTTPNTPPVANNGSFGTIVVDAFSGSVVITHNGTPTTVTAGSQGNAVQGDTIATGSNSLITLTFFEGSIVELDPSTTLVITSVGQTQTGGVATTLTLQGGATWDRVVKLIDAQSRFEIITPSTAVFVRGTGYRVAVDGSSNTTVSVMDGSVQVGV